jgi:opacity protein-like surface antigen
MKRFVILGLAIVLAACSSSSAPKDVFTGAWSGSLDGLTIATQTSQSGSTVSGSCLATGTSVNLTCTISGSSSAPSVNLTMSFSDSEVVEFVGSYVSRDSVVGSLREGTDTLTAAWTFVKQ